MSATLESSFISVILLGGLPASGKSTLARLLCFSNKESNIHLPDDHSIHGIPPSLSWHLIEADDFLEDEIKNHNNYGEFTSEVYHLSREKFKGALRDKALDLVDRYQNNPSETSTNTAVHHIILAVDNFQFTSMRLEIWKMVRDINEKISLNCESIPSKRLLSTYNRISFGQVLLKPTVEECVLRNSLRQQSLSTRQYAVVNHIDGKEYNTTTPSSLVTSDVIKNMSSNFDYGNIPRSRVPLLLLCPPLCHDHHNTTINGSLENETVRGTLRELHASLVLPVVKFAQECAIYVPLPSSQEYLTNNVRITGDEEELAVYSCVLDRSLRKEVTVWMSAFPLTPLNCGNVMEEEDCPKTLKPEFRKDRALFSKRMSILKKKFFESHRNGGQDSTDRCLSRFDTMDKVSANVCEFREEIIRECCICNL